jgi:beta-lactam-binding protein with PASTA domain
VNVDDTRDNEHATTSTPGSRRTFWQSRSGTVVLVIALLATTLVTAMGAGYQATEPDMDNAAGYLPKGGGVARVNADSGEVEAEAKALAEGGETTQPVVLGDGRVAVVNNDTGTVKILSGGLSNGVTVSSGQDSPGGKASVAVVPAGSRTYLVNALRQTVELVESNRPGQPVSVRGATVVAVPDGGDGIFVLTDNGRVVHVMDGRVDAGPGLPARAEHLTVADGSPVAITEEGQALAISETDLRPLTGKGELPSGPAVRVGASLSAGRYLLVLDAGSSRNRGLYVVDPRSTDAPRVFRDLPRQPVQLGVPVVLGDRVYVPDTTSHRVHVRDLSGEQAEEIPVPGKNGEVEVSVQDRRVWANDRTDRRAVVIEGDGTHATVDKGPGDGLTDDTTGRSGDEPDQEDEDQSEQDPTVESPPPSSKDPEEGREPAPELVAVPTVAPGTSEQDACAALAEAELRCAPMAVGAGGAAGTVRDTDPGAGARVPAGTAVRVHVYGPVAVPRLVGLRTQEACGVVTGVPEARFTCARQPFPGPAPDGVRLDEVTEQNPSEGRQVSSGATIGIRFYDGFSLTDLTGLNGDEACQAINVRGNGLVTCQVQPGGAAGTPAQRGTVQAQTPPAGTEVHVNETVILTVYGDALPQVPDVLNRGSTDACSLVAAAGYTCDPRPDGSSPTAVVSSQEPPGGTPLASGSAVVVHYSPHNSGVLNRYRSVSQPGVYVIRVEEAAPDGYVLDAYLGRAYAATLTDQPNTTPVFGYMCTASKERCGGREPNHYYSLDAAPDPDLPDWLQTRAVLRVFNAPGWACPQGQVLISRVRKLTANTRQYSVERIGPALPPGSPWDYIEPLGCVWA